MLTGIKLTTLHGFILLSGTVFFWGVFYVWVPADLLEMGALSTYYVSFQSGVSSLLLCHTTALTSLGYGLLLLIISLCDFTHLIMSNSLLS